MILIYCLSVTGRHNNQPLGTVARYHQGGTILGRPMGTKPKPKNPQLSPSSSTKRKSDAQLNANHEAKLSIEGVYSVRAMADAEQMTIREIAKHHHISKRQVNRIKARKSFAWLPERAVKS